MHTHIISNYRTSRVKTKKKKKNLKEARGNTLLIEKIKITFDL